LGKDNQLSFAIKAHMFPLNLDAATIKLTDLSALLLMKGEDGSNENVKVQKNKEEDMKGEMANKSDTTLGEYNILAADVGKLANLAKLVDICVIVPYKGTLEWGSD